VGVMANDPAFMAGSIDAAAAEKMTRFVDLCDTFRLPVVNFVDCCTPSRLSGFHLFGPGLYGPGNRRPRRDHAHAMPVPLE
jgi:Carboxyl transferase domain